ncbi:MAG: hypothetical protein NC411_06290 [Bacteroides sp.]|nr:hypothetical protein [Bacteroides sp.]
MKLRSNLIMVFAVVSFVMMCSCTSDEPAVKDTPRAEIKLSRSQQEYVDNESRFAFDFLKAVNQQEIKESSGNIAISPLSMARDLSMLGCGATDETLESILHILHIDNDGSIDDLNELNRSLLNSILNADNRVTLTVSNSFWYDIEFPVKESYTNLLSECYNAISGQVNFREASAVDTINSWCKNSTNGLIHDIFHRFMDTSFIKFALIDATYFNGKWVEKFKPTNKPMPFYNYSGKIKNVQTMVNYHYYNVGGDDKVSIVQIPYGNEAFSMYFIVADEGYDINDIISDIDFDKWNELKKSLIISNKEIKAYIPKFSIVYNPDLEHVFQTMGLSCNDPKLYNMSDCDIQLLNIYQKNSIKIDEDGTEAAVVTIEGNGITSFGPDYKEIHIDRPFLFLIEEYSTGAILFAGKVVEL